VDFSSGIKVSVQVFRLAELEESYGRRKKKKYLAWH